MPCTMLIDQNGKIAFKSFRNERSNYEQDFDDLLAGKEITLKEGEVELYGEPSYSIELSQE